MHSLQQFGACDCHSHIFGPFDRFPLSANRTFDPPLAPIEQLLPVWDSLGIDRAVLVQGSAHGEDPSAMLAAIASSPTTRRGIALLNSEVSDGTLVALHEGGIRGVRLNWIRHLMGSDMNLRAFSVASVNRLVERIARHGWHLEVHIDITDLDVVEALETPKDMPIVIDHMARIDLSSSDAQKQTDRLIRLLNEDRFRVKLSGGDRLTAKLPELRAAIEPMREILRAAPQRCVWGLDWPHVNLSKKRDDIDLMQLLTEVADSDTTLRQVLIENPAKLYGFPPPSEGFRFTETV
jgi:2-pyrone-4,6-dicarboxylate lactonase